MNTKLSKPSCMYIGVIGTGFLICTVLLMVLSRYQTQEIEEISFLSNAAGYVQTPIGGRPGTSDLLRPTLSELGIKQMPVIGQTVIQHLFGSKIYTGYERIRAQGDTILQKKLKTYGRAIPAHTPLKTGIKFDWYRIGRAYPVSIWWGRWYEIAPAVELVLLDFGYRFKTPLLASGRTYRHVGMRFGMTVKHYVDAQQVVWSQFYSIPGLGRLSLFTQSGMTGKDYLRLTQIAFKDSQPLPNQLFLELKAENNFKDYILQNRSVNFRAQQAIAPWPLSKSKSLDW